MAESVDALVSNTSRFTPVPVRPRLWVLKTLVEQLLRGFLLFCHPKVGHFVVTTSICGLIGHLLHYDDILNFQENSFFLEIKLNTKRDIA